MNSYSIKHESSASVDRAHVVVIGGGIIGCSIAYHLAQRGISDVLVLERNEPASGATARSAGCVSQIRSHPSTIQMVSRTLKAIGELEEMLGESLDFREVGCMRAVIGDDRERELSAQENLLRKAGIDVTALGAADARALCPWLDLEKARRIVYVANDGYIDGARLALAYARAARMLGARIQRGTSVSGIIAEDGNACAVVTNHGTIDADWVVDAAGAWGAEVASWVGWGFAAASTRSHYWITAPDGSATPSCPCIQIPDVHTYFRPEVGGLVVGMREAQSQTYHPLQISSEMGDMPLFNESADIELLLEQARILRPFVSAIDDWKFAHHIAGLSTYTPDGEFLIGALPHLSNFLIAGGCCGSGVAASGGMGLSIAELVNGTAPTIDISRYRPDRFGDIDPASQGFRSQCAAARSRKGRGASMEGAGVLPR